VKIIHRRVWTLGSEEHQASETREADDKLAKDVARLYSWANVDDATYRDFSRQRKIRRAPVDLGTQAQATFQSPPAPTEIAPQPQNPLAQGFRQSAFDAAVSAAKIPPPHAPLRHPKEFSPSSGSMEFPPASRPGTSTSRLEQGERVSTEGTDIRPVIALYSVAGGVGKTTLCANLGRALYTFGDRVLLIDASGSGLLPFYFGANDLSPGLHTYFTPEIQRPPMRILGADDVTAEWLNGEVNNEMYSSYWTLFDLGAASLNLMPLILAKCSFLLIPLLPDLNSILTVSKVESSLEAIRSMGVEVPSPFYLFNQFDPENPIDQGARELVLRQCGGRLLPLSIGYDPEASGAIAARKTVIDYAAGAEITSASMKLAALFQRAVTVSRTRRSFAPWNQA